MCFLVRVDEDFRLDSSEKGLHCGDVVSMYGEELSG